MPDLQISTSDRMKNPVNRNKEADRLDNDWSHNHTASHDNTVKYGGRDRLLTGHRIRTKLKMHSNICDMSSHFTFYTFYLGLLETNVLGAHVGFIMH